VEPRDRILGPISLPRTAESEAVQVDFGDLVRKLVLSEEILLESGAAEEFPQLVMKFGYDGVVELLRSRRLRIVTDWVTTTQTGQLSVMDWRTRKGILPLGSYSLAVVRLHDVKTRVHDGLDAINDLPGLRGKQAQKLRTLIGQSIVTPQPTRGNKGIQQAKDAMEKDVSLLKTSIVLGAQRHFGRDVPLAELEVRVDSLDETDFRVETNLGALLDLDEETVHKVIERGVLGIGGLYMRLDDMERYQAVTGFQEGEVPLMQEHLSFLARQIDPSSQAERFDRVVELVGLPDVDPNPAVHDVDMPRLLEIVQSAEAQEFRQWLRGIDALDNADVLEEIRPIREMIAHAVRSSTGKAVRFLATTGIGIPLPPVGVALGALDTFVTDKILREDGPTAFLGRLYPSVFKP
jgi:hypothetical protein